MKNLFTLIAAAGLTAGAWAATIFVPVEGPIDPLYKHKVNAPTTLPESYTLKGTEFINADGTKQSGTYHDLVDFKDGKLSYFDLSRLSNGYMLVYTNGAGSTETGDVIASYASGDVMWSGANTSRINVTTLLKKAFGESFKPTSGDKIIVKVKDGSESLRGQLWWDDNGEVKFTASADSGKNKDGYQEPCNNGDDYYFDFVLTGDNLAKVYDRLPADIFFTGDNGKSNGGFSVKSIEYVSGSETTQLAEYGHVNWNNAERIDIVPLLKAKYGDSFTLSEGDKLIVKVKNGNDEMDGQLYWKDGEAETKIAASANSVKNHPNDWQDICDDNGYYFDFVISGEVLTQLKGRWPKSIEFTGNDFDVESIEYIKASAGDLTISTDKATLTKTDEKIPTYADMTSDITSTSWETVTTKTYDSVQSVCWNGGDSNIKNLNLTNDIKGITFSNEYRILIGVDGTTAEHGQLIWNDNKYAYPDNGGSWGDGAYGGKDAKWSEQINGKTYFVFELTTEMAAAINGRLANDSETDVNFSAGNGSVKVASLTVQQKKVTTIKVGEYHAYNLWNAKDDKFIVDYGFDAGVWGFTNDDDGSAYAKFNSWCEGVGNYRYNIAAVEKYFEGEEGMAGQEEWQDPAKSLSPEYWAAVAPRFDAKLGDKVIVAIEPYYNQQDEWEKDNCTMQVWNVKEEDGVFKANILTWDDAKPDTDDHDLAIYENKRYDGNQLIWTFTLDTDDKVTQAKHGMRIKGRGFKVHRIDWIAQQQQKEEVNDGIFYIHIKPEAFKLHKDWEYANMTSEKFRPSVDQNTNHWGQTVDGSNASHNFPETVDLHFYTDKQTKRSQVAMEYYAYLKDGSEYPIAQFIGDLTAGNDIPASDKGFKEYAPNQMEELFNERVATTLNIAGLERYTCSCGEYEDGDSHYLTKLWYKPLNKVIEALESNGLYMKVTVTKAAAGVNARRRAEAAGTETEVNPTGLTFKPSDKQKDQYIEYSLPADASEPMVYFHRVGMQVSNLVVSTGVNGIEAENEAPAEIYNLQGIRVAADDLTPGVYVVRQGDKTRKVVIR